MFLPTRGVWFGVGSFLPMMVTLMSSALAFAAEEAASAAPQCYEVRTYLVESAAGEAALDRYLSGALLPALERWGVGPVGALATAPQDENPQRRVVLVVPLKSPGQLVEIRAALAADEAYQAAASEFFHRGGEQRAYTRVISEVTIAMDSMKTLHVPPGTLENRERIYELRTYESPTEGLLERKVEMFNSGELAIFLQCGIQPVFLSETLVGPQMPSLTYLSVYPSDAERLQAWETFRAHPDWKALSSEAKYAGTVSRIDKYVLVAKPYSQL